jgi:arylsulfatase A-like enzyme
MLQRQGNDAGVWRPMRELILVNRQFQQALVALIILVALLPIASAARKPNVVVILTDDQGFAELGVTGNPVIRTPSIDRLAAQSVSLGNFHVMPVCSPTRAGFLTGRYAYRTGVTDTWMGRSLIDPNETTVAEIFRDADYRTGIFGKWHLGDNYPRRAMDQGFQESLVLNGGGLAQPGDPPAPVDERGSYFNATLSQNGEWVKTEGYISDVITDGALEFIEKHRKESFFVYLSFNAPHSPHQVPDKYPQHYPPNVFNPANFPAAGNPTSTNNKPEVLAKVYGMVENIDENVGRLMTKLDALNLANDTIVVLFSDNGAQRHNGFNGGLRGWKGTPYEGGIRQFCFIRWPAQLNAGLKVDEITSHIDLAPTLLSLCDVPKPRRVKFDGRSLVSLLRGKEVDWPDRNLVAQWHRGDVPERYRSFAIRSQDWKLVQPLGREAWDGKTEYQLFGMTRDPFETHDIAAEHPQRVAELKTAYDRWFDDVTAKQDFNKPQRIFIGANQENPVLLSRQDWRGPKATWSPDAVGYWDLNILRRGRYDIRARFDAAKSDHNFILKCAEFSSQRLVKAGTEEYLFRDIRLSRGSARLEATLQDGTTTRGVNYVEISRR